MLKSSLVVNAMLTPIGNTNLNVVADHVQPFMLTVYHPLMTPYSTMILYVAEKSAAMLQRNHFRVEEQQRKLHNVSSRSNRKTLCQSLFQPQVLFQYIQSCVKHFKTVSVGGTSQYQHNLTLLTPSFQIFVLILLQNTDVTYY